MITSRKSFSGLDAKVQRGQKHITGGTQRAICTKRALYGAQGAAHVVKWEYSMRLGAANDEEREGRGWGEKSVQCGKNHERVVVRAGESHLSH